MPARKYTVAGRTFSKVAVATYRESQVHIVESGYFWKGAKSWEHRAVCGASISGTPITLMRVNCKGCRKYIERLQENAAAAGGARRALTRKHRRDPG